MQQFRLTVLFVVLGTVASFKLSNTTEEIEDEDGMDLFGDLADLAVAFPLVIQNLTNYSGLISGSHSESSNITHKFGHFEDDEAMLFDKASGFITVLHFSMKGQDGPRYCPEKSLKHIKECILIASCLLQTQVPQYMEMAMYASFLELMDRFLAHSWPIIENYLSSELVLGLPPDAVMPDEYICDDLNHKKTFAVALTQQAQLQSHALATSAQLAQAAERTHRILDGHNATLEATILEVQKVWGPLCGRAFECDENSFWDTHYSSHAQTMALMETGSAPSLRSEIRKRLHLERRVQRFMSEHAEAFGALMQSGSQSLAARYLDFNVRSEAALETWKSYGRRGKEALQGFVMPYISAMAKINETRATICFDQVEYHKFLRKEDRAVSLASLDEGTLDMDEDMDEDADEEGEDEEDEEDEGKEMASSRSLLSVRTMEAVHSEFSDEQQLAESLGDEVDEHEDSSSSRRRRRRRRRRRKGLFGRRRRRFGKKLMKKVKKGVKKVAKKAGKAVAKAAKAVAEFAVMMFGCIGDIFEFITVGYAVDIVPGAAAFGVGLTLGDFGVFKRFLLDKTPPPTWLSLDVGFVTGLTTKVSWTGVGTGVGIACSVEACVAYLSVGAMATVNIPWISPVCVFGSPQWGAFTCAKVVGGAIASFCCNLDVVTGKNDCR